MGDEKFGSKVNEIEGLIGEYEKSVNELLKVFEKYGVPETAYQNFLSSVKDEISEARLAIVLGKKASEDPSNLEGVLNGLNVVEHYLRKRTDEIKYLTSHSDTADDLFAAIMNLLSEP
jgi:hypothetical protein